MTYYDKQKNIKAWRSGHRAPDRGEVVNIAPNSDLSDMRVVRTWAVCNTIGLSDIGGSNPPALTRNNIYKTNYGKH